MIVTKSVRTVPPHIRQHPSREKEGEHKMPPLAEELLAFDSYRASVFFKDVNPGR